MIFGISLASSVRFAKKLSALFLLLSLSACNTPDILQDDSFNPPVYFGVHHVTEGDTLYSVAWRYGRDYKELAAANNIPPPYVIHPGQTINLALPEGFKYHSGSASSSSSAKTSVRQHKPAQNSHNATSGYKNKQRPMRPSSTASSSRLAWLWPCSGPIIDSFSVTGRINKGIDLSGSLGDPVFAAASGEVVYAGSGLLGYGQLIIVNHNDQYLSAYAHNRRILVKEGEQVKAGQQIAEIGSTGTNRPKLHFEIRRDGKPVNPLNYLPKR